MKLNLAEKLLVNNPVRAFIQHYYEAPLLIRMGGRQEGKHVLEVGCGRGVGIEIIFNQFGAFQVYACDVDSAMVEVARRRLSAYSSDCLKIAVGDATAIEAEDKTFDAVFDFGIIHHIPVWQNAISEIRRVLKPGGSFYFVEVTRQALSRRLYRTLLDHPIENRFSAVDFVAELKSHEIIVGQNIRYLFSGDFILGVGRYAGSKS